MGTVWYLSAGSNVFKKKNKNHCVVVLCVIMKPSICIHVLFFLDCVSWKCETGTSTS